MPSIPIKIKFHSDDESILSNNTKNDYIVHAWLIGNANSHFNLTVTKTPTIFSPNAGLGNFTYLDNDTVFQIYVWVVEIATGLESNKYPVGISIHDYRNGIRSINIYKDKVASTPTSLIIISSAPQPKPKGVKKAPSTKHK